MRQKTHDVAAALMVLMSCCYDMYMHSAMARVCTHKVCTHTSIIY